MPGRDVQFFLLPVDFFFLLGLKVLYLCIHNSQHALQNREL
jgi:hypothetical protein